MYIAIDIVIAVVVVATVVGAWRRGFIRSFFQLCTAVASVAIAACFYARLGSYFYNVFIYDKIEPRIRDLLAEAGAQNSADLASLLPERVRIAAESLGVDISALQGTASEPLGDRFAVSLSTAIANVAAFAALFFGALILLSLLCFLLDKIAKHTALNKVNKFFGFLFGVAEAMVLGVVLAKVAAAACSAYGTVHPDFLYTQVAENTYVADFFLNVYSYIFG